MHSLLTKYSVQMNAHNCTFGWIQLRISRSQDIKRTEKEKFIHETANGWCKCHRICWSFAFFCSEQWQRRRRIKKNLHKPFTAFQRELWKNSRHTHAHAEWVKSFHLSVNFDVLQIISWMCSAFSGNAIYLRIQTNPKRRPSSTDWWIPNLIALKRSN